MNDRTVRQHVHNLQISAFVWQTTSQQTLWFPVTSVGQITKHM